MPKNSFFPKDLECAKRTPLNGESRWFSPDSLVVFERSGFAAFGISEAGCAAPPPATSAARPVRAISSILHHRGICNPALAAALRSAARATRHSDSNFGFAFGKKEFLGF
jgi:hypothetical protein